MMIPLRLLLLATCLRHRRRRLDKTEEADAGVLEQRREDHNEAGDEEDVDALEVGDLREGGVSAGDEGGHGEHGGDAESDASRRRVAMQPERDPREDDDETRWDVDLNHVIAETAHEVELARQPRVITCTASHAATTYMGRLKPRPHQRQCRQKPRHCRWCGRGFRQKPRQCCSSSTPSPCHPYPGLASVDAGQAPDRHGRPMLNSKVQVAIDFTVILYARRRRERTWMQMMN